MGDLVIDIFDGVNGMCTYECVIVKKFTSNAVRVKVIRPDGSWFEKLLKQEDIRHV